MSLLLEITKCQQPSDYPLPYYDDSCRLNLYKSLLTTIISPHSQCIAQTSVALHIFTLGTTDHKERVSYLKYNIFNLMYKSLCINIAQ